MKNWCVCCDQTLSRAIANHRNAYAIRTSVEGRGNLFGSYLLWPLHWLLSKREIYYLDVLISTDPSGPDEAREKLLYLIALLTAGCAVPTERRLEQIIENLRPFKPTFAGFLRQNRST
jgi:hypothetical protein